MSHRRIGGQASPHRMPLPIRFVRGADGRTSGSTALTTATEGDKSDQHVLETAPVYAQTGYSVLMIDLRAQGDSEGQRITMGYQEARDVHGALTWLEERGFKHSEVIVHGWSMGAATALRAARTQALRRWLQILPTPTCLRYCRSNCPRPAACRPSSIPSSCWSPSSSWA